MINLFPVDLFPRLMLHEANKILKLQPIQVKLILLYGVPF